MRYTSAIAVLIGSTALVTAIRPKLARKTLTDKNVRKLEGEQVKQKKPKVPEGKKALRLKPTQTDRKVIPTTVIRELQNPHKKTIVTDDPLREMVDSLTKDDSDSTDVGSVEISTECRVDAFRIVYEDIAATLIQNEVGDQLNYPLYDTESDKVVGYYQDASIRYNATSNECVYHGVYSFNNSTNGFFQDQVAVQGTCTGLKDSIGGGTGQYTNARGSVMLNEIEGDDTQAIIVITSFIPTYSCQSDL